MKTRLFGRIIIGLSLVAIVGCTKHFVKTEPILLPPDVDKAPSIRRISSISVENVQVSDETKIWGAGTREYTVQSKQWSETAVKLLKERLTQKGFAVKKGSNKKLEISISDPDFSFWTQSGTGIISVKVKVKAGNGYSALYEGFGKKDPPFMKKGGNPLVAAAIPQRHPLTGKIGGEAFFLFLAVAAANYDPNAPGYYDKWAIQLQIKANVALALAVEAILNDREIIKYLQHSAITKKERSVKEYKMTGINYRAVFAGKTASGVHMKKGFHFKSYFGDDGRLIEVRQNGKRKKGLWTLDRDNVLCITWKNKKRCSQVRSNGDGSYTLSRSGKKIKRYDEFTEGKYLEN